mmetsp:Transcript_12898/g.37513  ORF Transcript_12898/g.37513 Transcript_12898/m.37513 type:complete len:256 (-) Transcript_12898:22-789(-)
MVARRAATCQARRAGQEAIHSACWTRFPLVPLATMVGWSQTSLYLIGACCGSGAAKAADRVAGVVAHRSSMDLVEASTRASSSRLSRTPSSAKAATARAKPPCPSDKRCSPSQAAAGRGSADPGALAAKNTAPAREHPVPRDTTGEARSFSAVAVRNKWCPCPPPALVSASWSHNTASWSPRSRNAKLRASAAAGKVWHLSQSTAGSCHGVPGSGPSPKTCLDTVSSSTLASACLGSGALDPRRMDGQGWARLLF